MTVSRSFALLASVAILCGCASWPAQAQTAPDYRETPYGNYLSGIFALGQHDWKQADTYLSKVLSTEPGNPALRRQAMILAMGSGNVSRALELAESLKTDPEAGATANLFLSIEGFRTGKFEAAEKILDAMQPGGVADAVRPLLKGWAEAGRGKLDVEPIKNIQGLRYHALAMAEFVKDKKALKALSTLPPEDGLTLMEAERLADIYVRIGEVEQARTLYRRLQEDRPGNTGVAAKLKALETGSSVAGVSFGHPVSSASQGAAQALFDVATALYREYSDDSARIFAAMALHLDPSMPEARFLMGGIASRAGRANEAITQFKAITASSGHYVEAQHQSADLLDSIGRTDEAIALLEQMIRKNQDLDAAIQIGDIERRHDDYAAALRAYDRAIAMLGDKVPKDYWHLLYARGMVRERLGQWSQAEIDLRQALEYQPEHPYILNYLGYSLVDRGQNLNDALGMIEKAMTLSPNDPNITDSMGWALFRLGRFSEAVPHLEDAVGMAPLDPVINDHLGDAYWRVGRRMEARFQWTRAASQAEDAALKTALAGKLKSGLADLPAIRQADNHPVNQPKQR